MSCADAHSVFSHQSTASHVYNRSTTSHFGGMSYGPLINTLTVGDVIGERALLSQFGAKKAQVATDLGGMLQCMWCSLVTHLSRSTYHAPPLYRRVLGTIMDAANAMQGMHQIKCSAMDSSTLPQSLRRKNAARLWWHQQHFRMH